LGLTVVAKIRDEGLVKNKAVYVALALNPDGEKDVLGLWIGGPAP
jgi:putative transposase